MTAKSRTPYHGFDEKDGKAVVFIPLAKGKDTARLFPEDFARLEAAGLTTAWCLNTNGTRQYAYIRAHHRNASGTHVTVARALAVARPGQCISYKDKDPCNLRRDNLRGVKGNARRADGTIVTSASEDPDVQREETPTAKVIARTPSAPFTFT